MFKLALKGVDKHGLHVLDDIDGLFDVGAAHARVSEGKELGVEGLGGQEEFFGGLGDGVSSVALLNLLEGLEAAKELLRGIGDEVFVHMRGIAGHGI